MYLFSEVSKKGDGKACRNGPLAYAPSHHGNAVSPGPAYPSLTLMFSKLEDNPDPRDFGQEARKNLEPLGNHRSTFLWFLPYGSLCESNQPASSEVWLRVQQALLHPPSCPTLFHIGWEVTSQLWASMVQKDVCGTRMGGSPNQNGLYQVQREVCGKMDADLPRGIKELIQRTSLYFSEILSFTTRGHAWWHALLINSSTWDTEVGRSLSLRPPWCT